MIDVLIDCIPSSTYNRASRVEVVCSNSSTTLEDYWNNFHYEGYSAKVDYMFPKRQVNSASVTLGWAISDFYRSPSVDRQLTLVGLSQELFKNSKLLGGNALEIMNKTSARLFSKTPTRL